MVIEMMTGMEEAVVEETNMIILGGAVAEMVIGIGTRISMEGIRTEVEIAVIMGAMHLKSVKRMDPGQVIVIRPKVVIEMVTVQKQVIVMINLIADLPVIATVKRVTMTTTVTFLGQSKYNANSLLELVFLHVLSNAVTLRFSFQRYHGKKSCQSL